MQGNVMTDARYQDYKEFNGILFPTTVKIERPRENYDIQLNILKLELNLTLTDDQFTLEQPAGAEIVHLSAVRPGASGTGVAGAGESSK